MLTPMGGCRTRPTCVLWRLYPFNRVLSGDKKLMRKRRLLSVQEETGLLREVEGVYEELVSRPIERSCVADAPACRLLLTCEIPHVTCREALLAARSWRAAGRMIVNGKSHSDGRCPFVDPGDQRCRIYSVRP